MLRAIKSDVEDDLCDVEDFDSGFPCEKTRDARTTARAVPETSIRETREKDLLEVRRRELNLKHHQSAMFTVWNFEK